MKFIKKEHHQVISSLIYEIPDEDVINTFGSIERFKEIVSHMDPDEWGESPVGDEPSEDEYNNFCDFIENYDYDREDDWWTDRKGGYDVTYEIPEDE